MTDRPPWEALLALVKAAEDAAKWIKDARAGAESEGTWSSLPHREGVAPGARGEREMRKLRAAIRLAKRAVEVTPNDR